MTPENNTSKKKWITPRKLGLSGKKTKTGNATWLPEGMTSSSRTCNTNTFPNHTGTSNFTTTTTRSCHTYIFTGQS